ncbi:2TM domain-containing protein [Flavobacteriaceae bacterium S0825]|uniref:2TM domain-containing protein n=1 Tax=Gaetbulibacter sp. S0825 TaxID=2720084 RepID=UPI001430720E|nr:2TM domain-containing protein [Gaetbulibacter sp. S0825]MCK0109258.1 2TM domain-containing protein [Flavobacteriaceae bacterium S0825]NIX64893.1 2TM domain-containing protein [Gaetbulibacter sp. S0825]
MNKKYLEAKRRVKSLRRFYTHLFFFLIVNVALMFNLIMLEKDESLNVFVWVILNIMITWSIGVFIHAWVVFKGRILFSKAYEDRKIEEFMKEEQNI